MSVLKSASAGLGVSQTARRFGVRHSTVYRWAKLEQMPKLAHYLKAFLKLGVPQPSRVWLTLESSHGYAVPVGQFAHVPTQIKDWSDVQELLIQLQPIERLPSEFDRNYLFGFLLGMIIGDAAKSKLKGSNQHRHLGLVLSQRYETNLNLGEFTCVCARSIGLRSFKSREATALANAEAVKAFHVPIFCPLLRSVRYQRLQKLALGRKPARGAGRLSPEIRAEIGKLKESGISTTRIVETILDKRGLLISIEAAQRWGTRPAAGG